MRAAVNRTEQPFRSLSLFLLRLSSLRPRQVFSSKPNGRLKSMLKRTMVPTFSDWQILPDFSSIFRSFPEFLKVLFLLLL